MAKKTPAPGNIAALLAGLATPKKKSGSKKDNPELDFHTDDKITCECGVVNQPSAGGWRCTSCDKLLSLTDRVYQAYQALQDAEARFKSLEAQLLEQVIPEYEEHAKGEFSKTLNVAGQETPGVQVSFKDQFKNIPLDKEAMLQLKMGDKYDTYFYQKREISLTDTSDEAITFLLDKLGNDFGRMFKIEMSVGTKKDMDRRQFELPGEVRLALAQYKPALKIRKEE